MRTCHLWYVIFLATSAYTPRAIIICLAQLLRNWAGIQQAPPQDWEQVVVQRAMESLRLGELKYFAARDEINDSTGAVFVRWCVGWAERISADEAVDSLFGSWSSGSTTYKPINSPAREFARCSTVLLGPPFVAIRIGEPPSAPVKPYVRICLGTHGSGKYTCATMGLDYERDAEFMLVTDYTPDMMTFDEFSALFYDIDAPNTLKELRFTSNTELEEWFGDISDAEYEYFKSKVDEVHWHHLIHGQYVHRRYKSGEGLSAIDKFDREYSTGEWRDKGHSKLCVGHESSMMVSMDSDSEAE